MDGRANRRTYTDGDDTKQDGIGDTFGEIGSKKKCNATNAQCSER